MHKTRPAHDTVGVTEVTGRVRDKIAIVGDDVIDDGRHADRRRAGARGARREGGLDVRDPRAASTPTRSSASPRPGITGLVVTDTVPIDPLGSPTT